MAAGTLVSRVTGYLRSAVLAAVIGTRVLGDVFTLANTIPNIIYILLAGGVLNSVLVPFVVRAMRTDPDGGVAYAQRLMTLTLVALTGITLIATAAAPWIIGAYAPGNYDDIDVARAVSLAYWCLPQIFFYGLFTVTGQLLNARSRFGPMMWAPVLNNLVAIATTLVLAVVAADTLDRADPASLRPVDMALLGGGATLGVAAQALVLLPLLGRAGLPWRARFDWRGTGLGAAGRAAVWTVLFVLVNQLSYLVTVRVVTAAGKAAAVAGVGYGAGSAAYSNAYLIVVLPHSVITVSLVTALLPALSDLVAAGRVRELPDRLSRALRLVVVTLVPATVGLVTLGPAVTTVAFGYGRTTLADTTMMGAILAAFAVGLVPFSAHYTLLRGFYALRDTRTPFQLQCVIAAVTVSLTLATQAVPASSRAVAVAGAWSAAQVVGYVITARSLTRRVGALASARLRVALTGALLAATVGGLGALGVTAAVAASGLGGYVGRLVSLLAGGVVLVVAYVAAARALGVTDVDTGLAALRRRLPGRRARPTG
jgi:putative peptidoglycan lipid II flippase